MDFHHRDGRTLHLLVYQSPLRDAADRHIGWMGSFVDITDRKRLEDIARRQIDALAQQARLTAMGELASTNAHELNQPLAAIASYIAGFSVALRKQTADAGLLSALDALGRHVGQAGRIVHRIRSRLAGRKPVYEVSDLNAVVTEAVDLMRRVLVNSGVRLELSLSSALPPLRADRVALEQVVTNLVRNAADALAGRALDGRIAVVTSVAVAHAGGANLAALQVDVCDNGTGLQDRSLDALCASFYTTKPDGAGLGLAICRRIIDSHGGEFSACTAPDGGARFSFRLPLEAAAPAAVAAGAA